MSLGTVIMRTSMLWKAQAQVVCFAPGQQVLYGVVCGGQEQSGFEQQRSVFATVVKIGGVGLAAGSLWLSKRMRRMRDVFCLACVAVLFLILSQMLQAPHCLEGREDMKFWELGYEMTVTLCFSLP